MRTVFLVISCPCRLYNHQPNTVMYIRSLLRLHIIQVNIKEVATKHNNLYKIIINRIMEILIWAWSGPKIIIIALEKE